MQSPATLDSRGPPTTPTYAAGRGWIRALPAGRVRIVEEDAELRAACAELPPAAAYAARDLLVSAWWLKHGRWDPRDNPPLGDSDCGYLLLDGLLLAVVEVESRRSAELLGAGDVFRADDPDTHGYAALASIRSFRVLAPARLVVLEGALMARIDVLPWVASSLQRRLAERARSLNIRLAIIQVPQLSQRLQLLMWHLADRFGRICGDGALIPFRLSHGILAECASAQRTSVLAALHELEERGALERTEEGHWLLHGEPPGDLA